MHFLGQVKHPVMTRSGICLLTLLVLQEFEERTEKVRQLKEEYAHASTGLQALTAAVEQKKVRDVAG